MDEQMTTGGFDPPPAPAELSTGGTYIGEMHLNDARGYREPCDNSDCQNPVPHGMEQTWIELASPVPKTGGLTIRYNSALEYDASATAATSSFIMENVDNSLARGVSEAMRPKGIDNHAIETVRAAWQRLFADELEQLPALLDSNLVDFLDGWEGEDSDRFIEQIGRTRQTMLRMLGDIDQGIAELEEAEEAIYIAQGREEGVLYPAADIWKAGSSMVNSSKIHVRPAWVAGGCPRSRSEGTVWEFLGLDRDMYADFDQYVEARASNIMIIAESRGENITEEQARQYARDEYDPIFDNILGHWSRAQQSASASHNSFIDDHRGYVESAQTAPSLAVETPTPATVADQDALDFDDPRLDPPPMPSPMPNPSLDDFVPPAPAPSDLDIPPPDRPWDGPPPSFDGSAPSYGGATPSYGGTFDGGGTGYDTDPWSVSDGDEELSGGLAGAAGAGGPGLTGAPSPGGTGAGMAGSGTMAAPMGAGGGARGAGAGSGRGGRGRMMGGGGGGRGGTGSDGENGDRDTWLTEDEDVWGITSEDDDPYA